MKQLLFCLIAVFSALTNCAAHAENLPDNSPVSVGVILPLTGPLASIGKNIQNSFILAQEKFGAHASLTFVFEDDSLQPKQAVSAAHKLIAEHRVKALVTFTGGPSLAVSDIAERYKVPQIAITAADNVTTGKQYVFKTFLEFTGQTEVLVHALQQRGLKRVALATSPTEGLERLRNSFLKRHAVEIVADYEVPLNETDLSTLASKIKASTPDAVVFFVMPPQLAPLTKYLRRLSYSGTFLAGVQAFNYSEIAAAENTLGNTLIPGPVGFTENTFCTEYFQRFGEKAVSEALYGYDAASLLSEAVKSADIAEFLRNKSGFSGVAGDYDKPDSQVFEVKAGLQKITTDGKIESALSVAN